MCRSIRSLHAAKTAKQDEFHATVRSTYKRIAAYLESDPDTFRVLYVRRAISVLILDLVEYDSHRLWLLSLSIPLVVFGEQLKLASDRGTIVAGGNNSFETQRVEVDSEIPEEVALERIVAIAVDDLLSSS